MKHRNSDPFHEAIAAVRSGADKAALRNFNFMNDGQPPSVGHLANQLGFDVRFCKMPKDVSARLTSDPFAAKGCLIEINEAHPRTRQRWSALHEIAHYYLHGVDENPFLSKHRATFDSFDFVYSEAEKKEEREANAWVEAILFGQNALAGAIGMYGKDLEKLSRTFGVSPKAIQIAMKRFG